MAGSTGSEEFDALIKLLRATSGAAVTEAENAAALVYQRAAQSAAPVKSGQLKASIKVIEGRPIARTLTGETRNRLFVGPEKKKGYHGYFQEKGWTATGPKRRARTATGNTHSQSGVSGGRKVAAPYPDWFERSQRSADAAAIRAAETAFNAKLEQLDRTV